MTNTLVSGFVIGAPKAGTTKLHELLSIHPLVATTNLKETHYFSQKTAEKSYYKYNIKILTKYEDYIKQFEIKQNSKVLVDICPSYLISEDCEKRIFSYNKDAHIFLLIRNPIDRAISHYLMDLKLGITTKRILDLVKLEPYYREYIENGLYFKYISKYKSIFGEKKIEILEYEELARDPVNVIKKLLRALDVQSSFIYEAKDLQRHVNEYRAPRNILFALLRKYMCILKVQKMFPGSLRSIVKSNIFERSQKRPLLTKERKILKDFFINDCNLLSDFMKKDYISYWLNT